MPSDATARDGQHVALVHERLRTAILRGEIPAGTVTSQPNLARDFEAGRTPLREALRLLQREGLVISEPHRRVRIADLSPADAEELYIMRIALETTAVRLTVPQLTSRDIAALEGLFAQMDHYMREGDRIGLREPHRDFHQLLVAGIGPRVDEGLAELFDHAERYRLRYGGADMETWEQRRAEHRLILEAVTEGDAIGAAQRICEHYARTAELIFAALDPGHNPERLQAVVKTAMQLGEVAQV